MNSMLFDKHDDGLLAAAREINSAASCNVARPWCDPSKFDEIVGIDLGAGGRASLHRLVAGTDHSVPVGEFIDAVSGLPARTLAIVEQAHFVPQRDSLSQPFTAEQLRYLFWVCERNSVCLLMAPEQHTTKMRAWAAKHAPHLVQEEKSTDANDARAIAFYVRHKNGVSLSRPPKSFERCPRRDYGLAVRKISNATLNVSRRCEYQMDALPHVWRVASALVPPPATNGFCFVDEKVAFSVASLVFCESASEGPVRFTFRGRVPGGRFWLVKVLGNTPKHRRGGVARSNIWKHRFPSFLAELARSFGVSVKERNENGSLVYTPFGHFNDDQEAIRREATRLVRKQLLEAYRKAVLLTAEFPNLDLAKDSTHGR